MTEQQTPPAGAASLAEEIRLLVEMVVERAAPWLDGVIAAGHGARHRSGDQNGDQSGDQNGTDAEPEPDSAACGWCPLCAIVAVVRGERPEFAARVLEQAAQLVALLRAVLADRWEPEEGVHMPGFQPVPKPAGPEPGTEGARVQHIPVRRSEDWER
ncbi:hypothetical protein [Amycolatopsis nigrescens]|uniref:hypothetical protein n=1 Tax=Amycolatopsis nigrescens TaxID=381445 RepID=UPI000379B9BC|nr:hypothetical protein [Amycolatopsis nigrescens]